MIMIGPSGPGGSNNDADHERARRLHTMSVRPGLVGLAAIAAMVLAPTLVTLAQTPPASPAASPVDLSDYSGLPQHATLRDGTAFSLAKPTAKRLAQHKPLTVYLSAPASSDARFAATLASGFALGVDKAGQSFLPLKGRVGSSADATSQAADIVAQADSGKVDCMVVWADRTGDLTDSVNHALAGGVPVVSIGAVAGGNELAEPVGYGSSLGAAIGDQLVGWMGGAMGHPLKAFAIAVADPTDPAVATRTADFLASIGAGVTSGYIPAPGPTFVTSAAAPLIVGSDPAAAYSAYKTFLAAHPETDLIAVMDGPADAADKAIADAELTGKVHTIGLTLDSAQLDAIDAGVQIAIVQPDWSNTAANGAVSCAQLLAGDGVTDTGAPPVTYAAADTARGRADLLALPGK
jgi:hypothetical protein